MRVHYDDEVDALYLELGNESPEGVVEITEGVNLDMTCDGRIVGIEILDASKKIDLKTGSSGFSVRRYATGVYRLSAAGVFPPGPLFVRRVPARACFQENAWRRDYERQRYAGGPKAVSSGGLGAEPSLFYTYLNGRTEGWHRQGLCP